MPVRAADASLATRRLRYKGSTCSERRHLRAANPRTELDAAAFCNGQHCANPDNSAGVSDNTWDNTPSPSSKHGSDGGER